LVGTVFSYLVRGNESLRTVTHSVHSLSLKPLQGSFESQSSWRFPTAGIDPKLIPNAPPPSHSAQGQTQMRELARGFSAAVNLEGEMQGLRLLPQPLFRNQTSSAKVLDGALFAFVLGTDPELMLLLQAQHTDTGYSWHYATARFSDLPITFRHRGSHLWTEEHKQQRIDPDYPYLSHRIGEQPSVMP
jgi:hypothetical protein